MQRCRSFFAMEAIANWFWVLCEHRAGYRLPPAHLLSGPNHLPNAVRSRNSSKSTLAHDAVAAAVSHKHHSRWYRPYPVCLWVALESWPWSSPFTIFFHGLFSTLCFVQVFSLFLLLLLLSCYLFCFRIHLCIFVMLIFIWRQSWCRHKHKRTWYFCGVRTDKYDVDELRDGEGPGEVHNRIKQIYINIAWVYW